MKNELNSVRLHRPNRNSFDLSHEYKTTCGFGELVPVMCLECLPGDKFNLGTKQIVRFQPMVAPVMNKFTGFIHYWFVPNRILNEDPEAWNNWIASIPGAPAFPTVTVNNFTTGGQYSQLLNYFGIPDPGNLNVVADVDPEVINAYPLAGYQAIYNHFYRDENLVAEIPYKLVPGDNSGNTALYDLRYRAYRKDYFTAALPFAQKGAAVTIPLGNFQDVPVLINNDTGSTITAAPSNIPVDNGEPDSLLVPEDTLYAQTSLLEAEAASINDLRRAYRLQEWLERNARGGTRPNEILKSHFGVDVGDARLQLPEFIVGTSFPIVVSEVLNTAGFNEGQGQPQGNMAGHAVGINNGRSGSYYCREHGFIIGIMSIMPEASYFQGIEKHWTKTTDPFEYFWPSFAHIGEQPIQCRELMAFLADADKEDTFGYIPRYAEYRFKLSRITGDFYNSLNFWTATRVLVPEKPALNQVFIETKPDDTGYIFAASDDANTAIITHILHQVRASRLIPKRGTPIT